MGCILIVGATGFVGSALDQRLRACGDHVRRALRFSGSVIGGQDDVLVGQIDGNTDWSDALREVDCVVHLAARVHVMNEGSADALAEYRRVNVAGTENLARQAADASVRRLVFISSIKVNGESTMQGRPFTADAAAAPAGPYGISKLEAEEALERIARDTGMEVVAIRPPLVYGPGVKANFLTMLQWLHRGIPLPLGTTCNKRSLIGLDNLVDLILTCIQHPNAVNQVFLAADGEDLSTTELLRRLAAALEVPARLLPVPPWILRAAATSLGRRAVAERLCGSLQVDISKARSMLGWNPPVSVDEGLARAARHFLESRAR